MAQKRRFRFDQNNDGIVSNELLMYMHASGYMNASGRLGVSEPIRPTGSTQNSQTTTPILDPTTTAPAAPSTTTTTGTNIDSNTVVSPTTFQPATNTTIADRPIRTTLPDGSTVTITSPAGVSQSAPIFGGGFGGGSSDSSESTNNVVETKKKNTLFPWLLLATGVFLIVKQPLK